MKPYVIPNLYPFLPYIFTTLAPFPLIFILVFPPLFLSKTKFQQDKQDEKWHTATNNKHNLKNKKSTLLEYLLFILIFFSSYYSVPLGHLCPSLDLFHTPLDNFSTPLVLARTKIWKGEQDKNDTNLPTTIIYSRVKNQLWINTSYLFLSFSSQYYLVVLLILVCLPFSLFSSKTRKFDKK